MHITALRSPTVVTLLASLAILSALPAGSGHRAIARSGRATAIVARLSPKRPIPPRDHPYPANIEYDPSGYGTYNDAALTDPEIDAVDINLNWYQVEPQPGVFNFAPADQEVAAWVDQGKQVTLELRFQHETNAPTAGCSNDGWLPSWVAADVLVFCEHTAAASYVIPDYFDPTFRMDWMSYVAAVARHFGNGPYRDDVAYARVALGLGAESFPLEPCYSPVAQGCAQGAYHAAIRMLQSWGYSASSWIRWQESLLAEYRTEFSFTTVIYPINQMLYPTDNPLNTNPTTGDPVQMDVAYWAAAHGMGVGQQGLRGIYTSNYADFNSIVTHILRRFPDTYIQFQTVAEVSNKGTLACSARCLVERDVQAAMHYHARSIEWYAADDANPAFQPYFAQWQQYVSK